MEVLARRRMVAVFGTMAADVLHVGLGVPYIASTVCYAVVLAVIFMTWHPVRGHALDSQHHHRAARDFLLGDRTGHVRARHRRR